VKIHPASIINPAAEIADDVEIGPFVWIDGPAIIGSGCVVQAHAVVTGSVRIGRNNIIGYGTVIGAEPQDHAYSPKIHSEVIIGDNNRFSEYCTIHRGTAQDSATIVGSHNFFMAGSHLAHNTVVGDRVILANNVLLAGHVEVQDYAYLGGGDVFHQFVRVGLAAHTQGIGGFSKDIPPFTIAAVRNSVVGVNVTGLRRAGFSAAGRAEVKTAFRLLYKSGMNTTQAIERAAQQEWNREGRIFFDFVASAKKRGICDLRKG
jgi:UDP-N-acetylglucosamine acyltransferase